MGALWRDVFRARTYLNLVYLFISFPLGTAYFVILLTGGTLGVGLLVVLVGALILAALLGFCWLATELERHFARVLLELDVRSPSKRDGTWIEQITAIARERSTWTGILFLLLKFPVGVACFVATVTVVASLSAMLSSPVTFLWLPIEIFGWTVDTLGEAAVAFVLGIVLLPVGLGLTNLLARFVGKLASWMLSAQPAAQPAWRR